ncbi:MAG: nicotinate (nicotinamide) nucleotide adenylyltransferase [Gemmatimonadetes bacterium]|nr:nicotinate (nicotinamide) nucleotide adenylyltransferase [Gemmatimonadota bacterium]MBP7550496.1 nicotinate-nucleotide adenylyltransferase [Gemmatimonadaceae bacterium]
MGERIGLLGGTFDPPHVGHLFLAYTALERLALDRVVLIPARRQPLKAGAEITAPEHRLAMTRLLAGSDPRLSVDPVELSREGLSFSIDTVRSYRAAHPAAELTFLMGEDTAATLAHWRDPAGIAALARIVVLTRGDGHEPGAPLPAGVHVERVTTRRIDISATEVRARARAGSSLRGFVTDDIAAYIAAHGLYRTTNE